MVQRLLGGGSRRGFIPGFVYVMRYKPDSNSYYKIGCSKHPQKRLKEIQKAEKKPIITLVGYVKANEMYGAETAAQEALKKRGFVKDPNRGQATDWFVDTYRTLTQEEVLKVIRPAVYRHNSQHK